MPIYATHHFKFYQFQPFSQNISPDSAFQVLYLNLGENMILMKDGRVWVFVWGRRLKLMEFKKVSCINRRTAALKLRNQRLLLFYAQIGHGGTIWYPQGYRVDFLKILVTT